MRSSRVLVTGASGFIGSHVLEVLEEAGIEAIPLLRPTSDRRWLPPEAARRARIGSLDDAPSLVEAVKGCGGVIHLAGAVRARDEAEYRRVNAEGTRNLLQAVERAAPDIERFVMVSSLAAIGPSVDGVPVDEDCPAHPTTAYGRSKHAGERAALEWEDRIPITIVRPPAVYGPRDRGILTFFRCASRGFLPRVGRGPRVYSLIHARDLALGISIALHHPCAASRAFFLAETEPYDWARLLAGFSEALGRAVRSITVPACVPRAIGATSEMIGRLRHRRPFLTREKVDDLLVSHWTCSTERAASVLGFRIRRRFPEGLVETARWYRDEGWLP